MEIIKRSVARDLGKTIYYTGKTCLNGHLSYRYVQSGSCAECVNGAKTNVSNVSKAEKILRLRAEADILATKALIIRRTVDALEKTIETENAANNENRNLKRMLIEERRGRVIDAELAKQERVAKRLREREIKHNKMITDALRKKALADFEKIKEPIRLNHVDQVQALLMAYAIMRSPHLTISDLWLTTTPVHGVLYTMKAHREDSAAIRTQLRQWYSADSNVATIQQNITNANLTKYDKPAREGSIDDITK